MVLFNMSIDRYLVLKKDLLSLVERGIVKAKSPPVKGDMSKDTIEAFESTFAMGLRCAELIGAGSSVAVLRPTGELEMFNGTD